MPKMELFYDACVKVQELEEKIAMAESNHHMKIDPLDVQGTESEEEELTISVALTHKVDLGPIA